MFCEDNKRVIYERKKGKKEREKKRVDKNKG
jgi:hypothetical protein